MTAIIVERPAATGGEPPASVSSSPSSAPAGPKPKSLWYYLRASLSAALLLLLLALAAAVIVVPALTKSIPLTVLTQSMEPKFPPGTLLIVQPVEPNDIRIGDVVTYQIRSGDPAVITHRVIEIVSSTSGERSFILQGDNNDAPDPDLVREVQVQGKLWYAVPYIGWVNTYVNGDNRSWVIPVVAGGLFLYAVWMVISGIAGGRKKKRRAMANGGRRRHAA